MVRSDSSLSALYAKSDLPLDLGQATFLYMVYWERPSCSLIRRIASWIFPPAHRSHATHSPDLFQFERTPAPYTSASLHTLLRHLWFSVGKVSLFSAAADDLLNLLFRHAAIAHCLSHIRFVFRTTGGVTFRTTGGTFLRHILLHHFTHR